MTRTMLAVVAVVTSLLAAPTSAQNFIQNPRFMVWREVGPITVPTGGYWFPEAWRVAPGHGATVWARLGGCGVCGGVAGQGNQLYLKWTTGQFDPNFEVGSAFLEHYIFEFDALAGHAVQLRFWARVDGCCVPVVPFIEVNYHNGDYEFICSTGSCMVPAAGPFVTVTRSWQRFAVDFLLPTGAGHVLNSTRYFSPQLTFSHATAPGIHLAHFELMLLD